MNRALTPLKRLYHHIRGTNRPRVTLIGVYPFDSDTLTIRFETSLLQSLDKRMHPRISVSANGKSITEQCIEMNVAGVTIGGFDLVRRAYSLRVSRSVTSISANLVDNDETFAHMRLDAESINSALEQFTALIRNAGSDERYAPLALEPNPSALRHATFTVIVAAPRPDVASVLDTIESVALQAGVRWNAIIASTADSLDVMGIADMLDDRRVSQPIASSSRFSDAVNLAISEADGEYILFLNQGDILVPSALQRFARCIEESGYPEIVYCDTDCSSERDAPPISPRFKPDFNRDYLYSCNFLPGCFALKRTSATSREAHPTTLDCAWNYELTLDALEQSARFAHIPAVLCHERVFEDANSTVRTQREERKALDSHLSRCGLAHDVSLTRHDGVYKTVFRTSSETPLVSIIIPNKDHVDYLRPCIESIHEKAGYDHYEIVVVENNSVEPETFDYYRRLKQDGKTRIVFYDGSFNYSKIINFGVRESSGSLLLLLNNDTKAITQGFLSTLVGYFTRPEIGVVGPRLLFPDGLVQHAGLTLLESGRLGFLNQNLSPALHRGYLSSLICASSCSAVLGACQMVRRSTFDDVSGYCEELAVTCNDLDFCWKVRELGLEIVYTPHVELFHKEFGSRNSDTATPEQEAQSTREYELMVERWPDIYQNGDGFINPNLDQESIYFKLGAQLPL